MSSALRNSDDQLQLYLLILIDVHRMTYLKQLIGQSAVHLPKTTRLRTFMRAFLNFNQNIFEAAINNTETPIGFICKIVSSEATG
ncbi:hypothetical protein BIW11_13788 [Tropilaelaps mercedesae]|uniref:Uncharacterized protein n=1 Tax=Tropilaelaps mercedesae TaxID=418985 RepID=A0A1V9X0S2_9ACAR|nr:hypothetical protein BIW11_13788 [Tropilaelaps mercedesae]